MPIVRIPYPNPLPTNENDFVAQNNLIEIGFLKNNLPVIISGGNIVQGAVFQVGGTVYYCNAATAIGGVESLYIKLTPSGDGSTLAADYVADLAGVTWSSVYNGYYDVGGNLYIFNIQANYRKGDMSIVLTHYTDTTIPAIALGSGCEINGSWHTNLTEVAIGGATANSNWYDIALTANGQSYTANFIARGTGVWDDEKQGLYDGNDKIVACVYRNASAQFINKNVLTVINRTVKIKIEIGIWDMNFSVAGSLTVDIAHGLINDNIRNVSVTINHDSENSKRPLEYWDNGVAAGRWSANEVSGDIVLAVTPAGHFDSASYNSVVINRGDNIIWYEV